MRAINYLIDDAGKKTAVMMDLGDWGKLSLFRDSGPVKPISAANSELPKQRIEQLIAHIAHFHIVQFGEYYCVSGHVTVRPVGLPY